MTQTHIKSQQGSFYREYIKLVADENHLLIIDLCKHDEIAVLTILQTRHLE